MNFHAVESRSDRRFLNVPSHPVFQVLRHRARPEEDSEGGLPFEAGFPLRILTMTAVFWTIEFLYIRLHIFSIPVVVRGVCYLIFVLTIDMLCYYIYFDLSIGITIEACPFWVIALIAVEKLLIETLIRRLHYCPIGGSHIKDDLQLFIEGLMTPPAPGCCGGTHRCDRHRATATNGHHYQPHNHHGHAHIH